METLTGNAALITGASRGIGRAIALRLASQKTSIYLAADGTAQKLAATAIACRNAGAPDAAWGLHDISKPGDLEQRARDVSIDGFGTPQEVTGVVAFMVSKDAAYVAGHALVMDRGYVIHERVRTAVKGSTFLSRLPRASL
jgi:NAD(P)-dependent dehydrogenase (short-subunit alcohol dehydrogenase family)